MKNNIILAIVILFGITSLNAQFWGKGVTGNKNYITKNRTVEKFDKIYVHGSLDIELNKGNEGEIKLTGESNILPLIETEVKGDQLHIRFKKNINIKRYNKLTIYVSFEDISHISVSGSGSIVSKSIIDGDKINAHVSGSGDIVAQIICNDLYSSVSGSGDAVLKGEANYIELKVSGSGDVKAYDLIAKRAKAMVSGSGDVQVYASEELEARVSGSGDVEYKGDPKRQNFKTSGSGDISKG